VKAELVALARHRLSRARETFQDAQKLLEEGSTHGATNRFYYAAFYAARALLALEELDSSKHSGVISLFNKHFVKTGLVQPEPAKILKVSFEKRQDSDYEDFALVTRPEVEDMQDKILAFLSACETALERLVQS